MRIYHNIPALMAYDALAVTNRALSKSINKLSTGLRINTAADDAAGLGISENLRADVRSLHQAIRNANDGMSIVNVAEGAMNEVSNILIRMRELAVQGSSDSVGATERGYLNQEFGQLRSELDRIVTVTEFNGQKLLDGTISSTGLDIQIGTDTSAGSRLTITVEDIGSDSLAISALGVDTKAGARTSMSALDTALTSLSTERAKLGAYSNRLTSTIANLNVSVENLTAANSRIRDVDVASETANMARSQVLVQAGVSMLAQANSAPMAAMRLLG